MADTYASQIQAAIDSFCTALSAKYVNFFDESTLKDLTMPWHSPRYIISLGTYACGVWQHGEDVHLICFTKTALSTSWQIVKEKLQLPEEVLLPSGVDMELSATQFSRNIDSTPGPLSTFACLSRKDKAGCKFFLRYCPIPGAYQPIHMAKTLIEDHAKVTGDKRPIYARLRNVQHLAFATKRTRSSFLHTYHTLRIWASANGLLGPELGYLSPSMLLWAAHAVVEAIWPSSPRKAANSNDVSSSAYESQHSLHQSEQARACVEEFKRLIATSRCVIQPSRTYALAGLAAYAVQETAKTEVRLNDGVSIEEYNETCFQWFLDGYDDYIVVETESWDTSYSQRAHFQEVVVPRNLRNYLDGFSARLSHRGSNAVDLRLWPAPLTDSKDHTMKAFVLAAKDVRAVRTDRKPFVDAVGMIVNDMRQEFSKLDSATALMNVRDDLSRAKIMELFHSTELNDVLLADDVLLANCAIEAKPLSEPLASTDGPIKLRSARSAISRVRHDPRHVNIEYSVGYVDRFRNTLVWMPLEMWGGKATEDEDFIPEHRIRQLKRSSDDTVIWDREKRLDLT